MYIAAAWRPAFAPDMGAATVWDLVTGAQRFPPVTVDFRIGDVAIAPDGSALAVSGGEQGRVLILGTARPVRHAPQSAYLLPWGMRTTPW